MYHWILIAVPWAAVMSLKAGWKMPEGMIYGLLDGRSSQLLRLPKLAAAGGRSHLLTVQVDGITRLSNAGRRQYWKKHCRDTRPGRKPLKVCQSKVGNSKANPYLPIKLAAYATQQGHWSERQGRQQEQGISVTFPSPSWFLGCILFSAPEKNECKDIFT